MVSILRLFLQIFKMKSSQKESIKNQPRQPFSRWFPGFCPRLTDSLWLQEKFACPLCAPDGQLFRDSAEERP
jgi:hypothetical protein